MPYVKDESCLPRGIRPYLHGHPEAVRLLLFMLSYDYTRVFSAPELRSGLGYDSQYNINKDLQQLKWRSVLVSVKKDEFERNGCSTVRWQIAGEYREGLKLYLDEMRE